MPDAVPAEFRDALARTALRRGAFGERLTFVQETASTNDLAAAMAEAGVPEGSVVLALAQTRGRGRLGREWHSPAGAGLYFSVVCRTLAAAPVITLAGGVAVAVAIRRAAGLPVEIKWPNDLVIRGAVGTQRWRKLAGILAEGATAGAALQHVVLGIGINVRPAAYPPALAGRATSLEAELGREVDAAAVFAEVLAALHEQIAELASGGREAVLDRWRQLAPSATGATVEWTSGRQPRRGLTSGIDGDGALLVRSASGIDRIVAGEVQWL